MALDDDSSVRHRHSFSGEYGENKHLNTSYTEENHFPCLGICHLTEVVNQRALKVVKCRAIIGSPERNLSLLINLVDNGHDFYPFSVINSMFLHDKDEMCHQAESRIHHATPEPA